MSETERRGKTITPPPRSPARKPGPQGGKTVTPPPPKQTPPSPPKRK